MKAIKTLMSNRMLKLMTVLLLLPVSQGFSVFGQSPARPAKSAKVVAPVQPEALEEKLARIAAANGLDKRLFQSLIYAESAFRPNARSGKGAGCLTQLMPATARRYGLQVDGRVDERFTNIDKCLSAGAQYLSFLLNQFHGDVRLALAGYNAGEGAVFKFGNRVPPYRETVQYVEKISALYYGQTGHGVALAFNQPLAQVWVNQLYQSWRPPVALTVAVKPASGLPPPEPQAGGNKLPAVPMQIESAPKKPVVTRVQLPEPNVRLRTESLTFQQR